MPAIVSRDAGASKNSPIKVMSIAWTSDASGNASQAVGIFGKIARAVFVPSGAPDAPTGSHVIVLTDTHGIDLLSGLGASLSATVASEGVPTCSATDGTNTATAERVVNDLCTFTLSGAGNTKKGTLYLYYLEV